MSRNNKKSNYILTVRELSVNVSRRNIKNINIYIRNGSTLLVTAPLVVNDESITKFILQKYDWIIKHLNYKAKDDENIKDNNMNEITSAQLTHLKKIVNTYAAKWEPVMGVHCNGWNFRNMKTRWGSCSVNRATIRINSRLAKYPCECIEYIVVHELTHLLVPSHNKTFKLYMTQFLPDWKERDKLLRQFN